MPKSFLGRIVHKAGSFIKARKITSGIILLVLILGGYYGYFAYKGGVSSTRYITANVTRGSIISSVTGTGQVSASSQVDLKTKASGDIIYVGVTNGQEVKAGTLIAQLDARDAQKVVRDAEANLESAKISYQKLVTPPDALSLIQAENSLSGATASLAKAYDDGFNSVSNAFLDLPVVMAGLYDIGSGTKVGQSGQDNLSAYENLIATFDGNATKMKEAARNAYLKSRSAYDKTSLVYQTGSRSSEKKAIEALINETYDTTKTIADAVKITNDFLSVVKDRLTEHSQTLPSILATHLSSLSTYIGYTNSHLLSLLAIRDTITSSKSSISEKTESFAKLKAGADPLDISSAQLTIRQRENALQDAKEHLADYFVRAPFNGTVATLPVKKGDSAGNGASVGSFITKQRLAAISLNEVDVSKIAIGQRVTLAFDAIEGLSFTGEVTEIDSVGTVNQGVVTYGVKIGFDTQDTRVKPGMSVSAAIITNVKQDILIVPNSAVKQQAGGSYVEVMPTGTIAPYRQTIEAGLSNDTMTEVITGLNEGDTVVTQTITQTVAQSSTVASTGLRIPGITGSGGGGGGFRGGGVSR